MSPKRKERKSGQGREIWQSRIGLILAMAGNAVGLGNFLRFPVQATENGGGAFMIPYFVAFLLLGIPLMWMEWSIGRYGGVLGHGSAPGMFQALWKNPIGKYLGVLGIFLPLTIVIYYTYIESWTLAFSIYSASGKYFGADTREAMGAFLKGFQGLESNQFFSSILPAYLFFLVTLSINLYILSRGIVGGIERLAKIAMPLLFIFAIILVVRILSLGSPDPAHPGLNVMNGLAFIWNPDFSQLTRGSIWLAASGQIFFTMSLGMGAIHCYASYLRKKDDIVLTGLTTSMTNEFCEVVLGGTIAIPVAFAFFGATETMAIARGGAFDLAFQSMPVIFQRIPVGALFGALWFSLLFFAGITSSVALCQPSMAFLQDELGMGRERAVRVLTVVLFIAAQPVVFLLGHGFLDEMDYWAGTFGLVVLAMIESVLFVWIFGMDNAWREIHEGADIRVPRLFYYVMKYVTPLFLIVMLIAWFLQDGLGVLLMEGVPEGDVPSRWAARLMMACLFILIAWGVRTAWKRKGGEGG
jgi:NSS family neurotransmitter:Na+ symporter